MTLRAGKPDPYQVRKEVDNYENTSLFDNMFINGKSVESRKRRRERRRELAQQKRQDTDLQKTSDMTKKAPKMARLANNSENIKQAALVKLATVKLAINYILRNRGMSKQAVGTGFLQGLIPAGQWGYNQAKKWVGNAANKAPQGGQAGMNNRGSNSKPTATTGSMPNYGGYNNISPGNYTVDPSMGGQMPGMFSGQSSIYTSPQVGRTPQIDMTPQQPQLPPMNGQIAGIPSGQSSVYTPPQVGRTPQIDMTPQSQPGPQTRKEYTKQLKQQLGLQGPNITWNKRTRSYDLGGRTPEEARQALLEEKERINGAWGQMGQNDKDYYQKYYDRHINSINDALAAYDDEVSISEDPNAGGEGNYINDSFQDVQLPSLTPTPESDSSSRSLGPTSESAPYEVNMDYNGEGKHQWNYTPNFNEDTGYGKWNPNEPPYNPYGA